MHTRKRGDSGIMLCCAVCMNACMLETAAGRARSSHTYTSSTSRRRWAAPTASSRRSQRRAYAPTRLCTSRPRIMQCAHTRTLRCVTDRLLASVQSDGPHHLHNSIIARDLHDIRGLPLCTCEMPAAAWKRVRCAHHPDSLLQLHSLSFPLLLHTSTRHLHFGLVWSAGRA